MKDINFFSIYYDKSSTAYKRKRMLEIGLLILLIIALIYAGLTFWKMAMERETQEINQYLMSEEAQKSIAEYNLQSEKLKAMQDYNLAAGNLIDGMDKIYNLTPEEMDIISKSLPLSSTLQSFSYSNGQVSITARVPQLDAAAQVQVRLEETNLFQIVYLNGVSQEEGGGYICIINAVMKVGEPE